MEFSTELAYAQHLDAQDELASFRERFVFEDPELIYLDGNSLGRMPKATKPLLNELLDKYWGERLIRMWREGWFDLPRTAGAKVAGVIGAQPAEVVVADSTSVNLFKLALAAVQARPGRHKIVTDNLNFPSDLYILQGICEVVKRPLTIQVIPSPDDIHGPVDALAAAIDDDTALVTLTHTVFKSAYVYDMAAVTKLAHDAGALMLWDLSHSAGSVVVELNKANADLAVGCTYKYLNSGPGAPAFLYVRQDLQAELGNPVSGWIGQKDMFDFGLDYQAAEGVSRFLTGTPTVLSMAPVLVGAELLLEAGMERLRAKSVQQTEYLIKMWETELKPLGFVLKSPLDAAIRGSHVALGHVDAWPINLALINEKKVLPDFRQPDNIRLGIAPLYTSFADIFTAVSRLRAVVEQGLHEKYREAATGVT